MDCTLAPSLYQKNAGLFAGAGSRAGKAAETCPAVVALGAGECEGRASTCWSPGQADDWLTNTY